MDNQNPSGSDQGRNGATLNFADGSKLSVEVVGGGLASEVFRRIRPVLQGHWLTDDDLTFLLSLLIEYEVQNPKDVAKAKTVEAKLFKIGLPSPAEAMAMSPTGQKLEKIRPQVEAAVDAIPLAELEARLDILKTTLSEEDYIALRAHILGRRNKPN